MRVKTGSGHIKVARAGAVLGITFDRPEKKNALDGPMYLAATEALQSAGSGPSIGAILFAGAGGVFTFGALNARLQLKPLSFFTSVTDLKSLCTFYIAATKGILRKQDIRLPLEPIIYEDTFDFSEHLQFQWNQLFKMREGKVDFSYFWRLYELFFLRLMDTMGFNYRNVLHLSHSRQFGKALEGGTRYHIKIQLVDISVLKSSRAVLLVEGVVFDEHGEECSRSKDHLHLKNVDQGTLQQLISSQLLNRSDVSEFISVGSRLPQLHPESPTSVKEIYFDISPGLGLEYGLVSGDLNPLHTSYLLAKAFGYDRPFLQGACTANFVLKLFQHDLRERLDAIQTVFCKPLYLGQRALLRYDLQLFEVFDSQGVLVAYGHRAQS